MHRYFLIPFIGFFIIVSAFVFFLQFINEDWKFIAPKIILPESCDNNIETKFIIHESDKKINRSFKDEQDIYDGNQFHPIFYSHVKEMIEDMILIIKLIHLFLQ